MCTSGRSVGCYTEDIFTFILFCQSSSLSIKYWEQLSLCQGKRANKHVLPAQWKKNKKQTMMLILEYITWWKYRTKREKKHRGNTENPSRTLLLQTSMNWNIYRQAKPIHQDTNGASHGWNSTQRPQAAVQNQPHGQQCAEQLTAPTKEGGKEADRCRATDGHQQ